MAEEDVAGVKSAYVLSEALDPEDGALKHRKLPTF